MHPSFSLVSFYQDLLTFCPLCWNCQRRTVVLCGFPAIAFCLWRISHIMHPSPTLEAKYSIFLVSCDIFSANQVHPFEISFVRAVCEKTRTHFMARVAVQASALGGKSCIAFSISDSGLSCKQRCLGLAEQQCVFRAAVSWPRLRISPLDSPQHGHCTPPRNSKNHLTPFNKLLCFVN